MPGKKQNEVEIPDSDEFGNLSDEELMEFIKKEGGKDASVLAKLIMIQRIRQSLVRERFLQRVMTVSAIVVSVLALVIGIAGYFAFQNFLDERSDRTATACRDDHDDAINDNKNLEQQVDDLYFIESLSVDPVNQPVQSAFLVAQVDEQVIKIRSNYQMVRDCSDSGISAYNRTRGEVGYLDGPQVSLANRRNPVEIPPEIQEEVDQYIDDLLEERGQ